MFDVVDVLVGVPFDPATVCNMGYDNKLFLYLKVHAHRTFLGIGVVC